MPAEAAVFVALEDTMQTILIGSSSTIEAIAVKGTDQPRFKTSHPSISRTLAAAFTESDWEGNGLEHKDVLPFSCFRIIWGKR